MKLNKKISALLSCILACSTVNPASALDFDDEEIDYQDDNADDNTDDNTYIKIQQNGSVFPQLLKYLGGSGALAYGGYKGLNWWRHKRAISLVSGTCNFSSLSDSDKKCSFLFFWLCKKMVPLCERAEIAGYWPDGFPDDIEQAMVFNLMKLLSFPASFLEKADNFVSVRPHFKHIFWLLNPESQKPQEIPTPEQLLEQSERAVEFLNSVLDKQVDNSVPGVLLAPALERSKLVVDFLDCIGVSSFFDIFSSNIVDIDYLYNDQVAPKCDYKIYWYKSQEDNSPRAVLEFSLPEKLT